MAAVLLVAVVVIIAVVVDRRTSIAVREPDTLPSTEVTGWDDSSPLPSDTPTVSPSAAGKTPVEPVPTGRPIGCDQYAGGDQPSVPDDGRVHGGPLSFEELGGDWDPPVPNSRFPYSRQAYYQSQVLPEDLAWEASAYAGVSTVPDYTDGDTATNQLLQCVVTSDFYVTVDVQVTENAAQSITVDGTPATQRDALLRFEHRQLETTGSRVRIIIVESSPLTFYFHAVPMERQDLITELDHASSTLRLD